MSLSEPKDRILHLIGRMHYLTAEQITRRYWGRSKTLVQRYITELSNDRYLIRYPYYQRIGGRPGSIYALDALGNSYLLRMGAGHARFKPTERETPTVSHLAHTLVINDILIDLEKLDGDVRLARFIHERDFKRMRLRLQPDAWIDIRKQDTDGWYQDAYMLEVDMGTEPESTVRGKIQRYTTFIGSSEYERLFATKAFAGVLFVAMTPLRANVIRSWINAETRNHPALKEAFRVYADPADVAPNL